MGVLCLGIVVGVITYRRRRKERTTTTRRRMLVLWRKWLCLLPLLPSRRPLRRRGVRQSRRA